MGFTSPVRVRLSRSGLAGDLAEALTAGDCICAPVDGETLLVVHRAATDDAEALVELTFFLRAWQSRHDGLRAEVLAD
jgi:hypothetical protein